MCGRDECEYVMYFMRSCVCMMCVRTCAHVCVVCVCTFVCVCVQMHVRCDFQSAVEREHADGEDIFVRAAQR